MKTTRRDMFKLLGLALVLAGPVGSAQAAQALEEIDFRYGKVFTSTNATAGNELLVYDAGPGGSLTLQTRLATRGLGSGSGLGSQGAVTLSRDGQYLFVVNNVSNTVSTFSVQRDGLTLISTVDTGDGRPISVTEFGGIVYVLNENVFGSLLGFRNSAGVLTQLPSSYRALSPSGPTDPGQVGFSPDGSMLIVTLKATDTILTYRVAADGVTDSLSTISSSGPTPFGVAFDKRGNALVAEFADGAPNAGAVSSYRFAKSDPIRPVAISTSVRTTQTGTGWIVVTTDGRYAYTSNFGSGTISSFTIGRTGRLALANAVAATAGVGPTDIAISPSERALYVLNAGSPSISAFAVGSNGVLSNPTGIAGLPVGVIGLAAN